MTIGQRAVKAIYDTAEREGITAKAECELIGINPNLLRDWRTRFNPSAYLLADMAKVGYDVMWILLGDDYGKRN